MRFKYLRRLYVTRRVAVYVLGSLALGLSWLLAIIFVSIPSLIAGAVIETVQGMRPSKRRRARRKARQ